VVIQEYTVFSIPIGVVYRPNEQKVRNVKQKDYLGKARLVAASDRENAFTGFAGSEVKKILDGQKPVDDRKDSEISWAATNLVKPGLVSSQRLQEENAQVGAFPPTPPPEKDMMRGIGPQRSNTFAGSTRPAPPPGRSNTYRQADPRDRAREEDSAMRRNNTTRERAMPPPPVREERRDSGSSRSRGYQAAPTRSASTASTRRQPPPPLRERRRPSAIEEQYSAGAQDYTDRDELYDLYREEPPVRTSQRAQSVAGSRRGQSRRAPSRQRYVEEEPYSDDYEGSSVDDDFEILETRTSRSGGSRSSRQIEVKKYKVKCHGKDDTRMIVITPNQDYREFTQRIKDKFGITGPIKCKVRDEDGDGFIALYDQEDLENCIGEAKKQARKEKSEMGKIEIWVTEG
jgi:hypothetical protein